MHAYCSQKLVVLTDGSWSAVDELLIAGNRQQEEAGGKRASAISN